MGGLRWSDDEIITLKVLYSDVSNEEISKVLGREAKTIREKANRLGLCKFNRPKGKFWTDKEVDLLFRLYTTTSLSDLERMCGHSKAAIKTKARCLGLSQCQSVINESISKSLTRKIDNENYFRTIDTEGKAYFLGLLWADGGIPRHRKNVMLKLIERDKHILDSLQEELQSVYKLTHLIENSCQNTYTLCVSSRKIVNDLSKYNIVPNKTYLDLDLPELPDVLIRHFFRGLFDGDGCITGKVSNQGLFTGHACIAAGSLKTCEWALYITKKHLEVGGGVYVKKNSNTNYWVLSGKHQLSKLAQWLYKDATFYLFRKHNKFTELGLI
jgi:hypothetical protein